MQRSATGREVFVKVRSTRAPQPAWLRGADGVTRSSWSTAKRASRPGRPACSMMRPVGQARVLGGGFIQSAAARPNSMMTRPLASTRQDKNRQGSVRAGAWQRHRPRRRREGLWRAGRRSTISCSARCSTPAGIDHRRGRPHRRAHARCRRRHRPVAVGLLRDDTTLRRRYFRADAAQGAGARARAEARAMSRRWR